MEIEELALRKKVNILEDALIQLVRQSRITEMKIARLSEEMKDFKDEMKDFKDEMKDFKDKVKAFKDGVVAFQVEMNDFKDEMREFKIEVNEDRKRMNKQWGKLANKMGTIVEDIVAPAICPVVRKYFNCDPGEIAIRIKRKRNGLKDEFNAICVCKDKVFLFEVKSTPRPEYEFDFKNKKKEIFFLLFPEHKDKELVLIFASLRLEEDILNLFNRKYLLWRTENGNIWIY